MLKLGTLFYDIKANTSQLHDAQQEVSRVNNKMASSFKRLGGLIAAAFSFESLRRLGMLANRVQLLDIRVRNMTKSYDDFVKSQMELLRISSLTGTSLTNNVRLFEALTIAAKDVGASNTQVLILVETLRKIGVVGGTGLEQMNNALLQFGQAMAGGIVRAEEFNSIVENTPLIAKAIADGMDTTVGMLRRTILDPKNQLLSTEVFNAILKQAKKANADFERMPLTMERAWESFQANAARSVSDLDSIIGATELIADWIMKASKFMEEDFLDSSFDVVNAIEQGVETFEALDSIINDSSKTSAGFASIWESVLNGISNAPLIWAKMILQSKTFFDTFAAQAEYNLTRIGVFAKNALNFITPGVPLDKEDMAILNKAGEDLELALEKIEVDETFGLLELEQQGKQIKINTDLRRKEYEARKQQRAQAKIDAKAERDALLKELAKGKGGVDPTGDGKKETFKLSEYDKLLDAMGAANQDFLNKEKEFQAKILELSKEGTDERKRLIEEFNAWKKRQQDKAAQEEFEKQKANQMVTYAAVAAFNDQFLALLEQAGREQTALGKMFFYANKVLQVATILAETEVAASKAMGQLGATGIPIAGIIRAAGYASAATVAAMTIGGAVTGTGRLAGGEVYAGKMHPITEDGNPEILQQGARQYLLPGNRGGKVTPLGGDGASLMPNVTIVNNGTPTQVDQVTMSDNEIMLYIKDAEDNAVKRVDSSLSTGRGSSAKSLNKGFKLDRRIT